MNCFRHPAIPLPAPGWDESRPAESFKAFADQIRRMARDVLLRDGNHAEMLFFMPSNGQGHVVLWRNNDRDLEADWIRKHIAEHHAYGVIHVVEAWVHFAVGPGDPDHKRLINGELRVSQLPEGTRKEALMITAQSRGGWSYSWIDEIVRDAAGKPLFGDTREFADFQGRFGELFGEDARKPTPKAAPEGQEQKAAFVLGTGDRFHRIVVSEGIRFEAAPGAETVVTFYFIRRNSGLFDIVNVSKTFSGKTCTSRNVQTRKDVAADEIASEIDSVRIDFALNIERTTGLKMKWHELDLSAAIQRCTQQPQPSAGTPKAADGQAKPPTSPLACPPPSGRATPVPRAGGSAATRIILFTRPPSD